MNKRQVEILGRVLADANFYTVDKLSTIMGKSKRTIYADLNQINDYFSTEGINIFVVNESGAIDKHRGKEGTKELVEKINFYDYELNVEERVTLIISLLFFSTDYITIQTIADRLYCSRTTILKDMVKVKKELIEADIEVISYQNKGLTIKGTELAIRKKFVQINEKHLILLNMFLQASVESSATTTTIDSKWIQQILSYELLKNHLSLTDNSHQILENYLSFSSCRLKMDKKIQNHPTERNDYENISKNILAEIFPELEQQTINDEANYLAVLIQNMKFIKHPLCEDSMVTIHLLVRIFLEELSKVLIIDLTHDSDLFTNLSNHLFDMFNKTYSQGIESKEIIYFMEKNSELVTCIKKQVAIFEKYLSRTLSNVEIGYLALHISASIEKGSRVGKGLRVLLICNSGVGTSQLLKARLAHHYIFAIVDTLSIIELPVYDIDQIDLIISTVDLNEMIAVPNAKVSLNVTEKDRQRIDQTIKEVNRNGSNTVMIGGQRNHVIQNIAPLVQQYDGLLNQLENTITNYFSNSESYVKEKLTDFITEDLIDIDVQAQDWEEAVLKGTKLLETNGKVTKQFGKEIIKSLKLLGPYLLLANDTAFPHAGFDQGAIATSFSFIRLATPVSFTNDQSDDVDLIFTLSASDNQKHINALFSLLEIVNNQVFKAEIRKATSKQEIMDTIIKYETLTH